MKQTHKNVYAVKHSMHVLLHARQDIETIYGGFKIPSFCFCWLRGVPRRSLRSTVDPNYAPSSPHYSSVQSPVKHGENVYKTAPTIEKYKSILSPTMILIQNTTLCLDFLQVGSHAEGLITNS